MDRALEPRDHCTETRATSLHLADEVLVPGQALAGRMVAAGSDDRTDHHKFIHDPRQAGHVLADFQPRHVRRDRPEFAADALGGSGLRSNMSW